MLGNKWPLLNKSLYIKHGKVSIRTYVRPSIRHAGHGQLSSEWRCDENDVIMTTAGLWRHGNGDMWPRVATLTHVSIKCCHFGNYVCYFTATHLPNHSHLSPLKCVNSFTFFTGHVSLPCNIQLYTQFLYNFRKETRQYISNDNWNRNYNNARQR